MAVTLCINCTFFYDSNNPKSYPDGSEGDRDICNAPGAPITDFVRGRPAPNQINTAGTCTYYVEKT